MRLQPYFARPTLRIKHHLSQLPKSYNPETKGQYHQINKQAQELLYLKNQNS